MGFNSYVCAKSNLPILANCRWGDKFPTLCKVVAVAEHGPVVIGNYDGYGRVAGIDVSSHVDKKEAKLVLAEFYNNETLDQLGSCNRDPLQGAYHDEEFLTESLERGGYTSYTHYCEALEKHLAGNTPGSLLSVSIERVHADGRIEQLSATLRIEEDIIMCGGEGFPGVVMIQDENAARLNEFEQECITLTYNEGSLLSFDGKAHVDPEYPTSYLRFTIGEPVPPSTDKPASPGM
jgi:hypothetical protein